MSSVPPPEEIARDARWLVQALDGATGMARLIEMDPVRYRLASFLDDRIFQQPQVAHWMPWSVVAEAASSIERRDARWIFHIGHVGSTLIARLLGELPNVLSIREPRFLRDIAGMFLPGRLGFGAYAQPLFSRSFGPNEVALVKATSFVSEIAAELVPPAGRALFIYASAPSYIGSILAGETSLREAGVLAASRAQRMEERVGQLNWQDRSDAHRAAAAWACEMTALESTAELLPAATIEWIDFDRALGAMGDALIDMTRTLGLPEADEQLRAIANGALMTRYSKALEYEYSPALRRELIAEAGQTHRSDIRDALAMLEHAAQDSPLLARALSRSMTEA